MKIRIVPYKKGSKSAKLLAQGLSKALGYKVWRGHARPLFLNLSWGCAKARDVSWINNPWNTYRASNKLLTFEALESAGIRHVPYTTSKEIAEGWSQNEVTVLARTLTGQGGSGITIVAPGEAMPNALLYTKYFIKQKEFRVHAVGGKVIDVQQKRRKNGADKNVLIWNHKNDYVFCHKDVEEPVELRKLGVDAVAAVGLDFGAVDLIWNQYQDQCFVLEVNTAPGLCETTCEKYVQAVVSEYSHPQGSLT